MTAVIAGVFPHYIQIGFKEEKMRKVVFGCSIVLCCAALMLNGCAKKEVVKQEEPVASSVPAAKPEQAKPAVKEEPVAAQPIKEAPVATREEAQAAKASSAESLFDTVYFAFDSSDLSQQARNSLSKNADVLTKKEPSLKVQIQGNCDERGSAEYNLALGERRAKAAMKYLVTLGVKADRLSTISYGKERPVDQGHDEAAWAKNRRDDFVIAK